MGVKLEVFRMLLYLSFPVTMFWVSNQAGYFEEHVVRRKREIFPPEDPERGDAGVQAAAAEDAGGEAAAGEPRLRAGTRGRVLMPPRRPDAIAGATWMRPGAITAT
ncbi:uncharacterized protein LOC135323996 isoform X1 [Dromaius novaehollandiae]|uniref:uncharacterized protein LOC135323996 isoform X1 n=1 Tax=Dromaius novaehollandiae TaxID=8790 RepID=UPI00311E22E3